MQCGEEAYDLADSESDIKRWTAKRKTQVVLDILTGKTTVTEVSRQHDLTLSEVGCWVDEGVSGIENGFRSRPRDIREQLRTSVMEGVNNRIEVIKRMAERPTDTAYVFLKIKDAFPGKARLTFYLINMGLVSACHLR